MTAPAAVTHARVLRIAVPIVLSNATVPLLGVVDTAVVGQLGSAAPIGAVGLGATILTALTWIFGFLRMGTSGLAAQAAGQGDVAETDAILARATLVGLAGGVALIVLQWPIFALAFAVAPASDEVEALARAYISIRIFSAPAAVAIYGVTGWLIAQERTVSVLVLQIWMNGLNIALSVLFVLGLDMGVPGVAWASFAAEWSALGLAVFLCRGMITRRGWRDRARVLDVDRLKRMASVNTDILIRTLLLQAVFLSFMFFAADLGDVPLAANQILLQFLYVTAYALDGFAFAVESLAGRAVGARDRAMLRRSVALTALWSGGIACGLALVFAGAGGLAIEAMTTAEPVRAAARAYLPFMVAAPVVGCASWILDGISIGATRTRDMRNMMALSALAYAAAAAALLPVLGNAGLWTALLVSFVARAATLAWRYPRIEAAL